MSALWKRFKATGQRPTVAERVARIACLDELEGFRLQALARDAMTDDVREAILRREKELRK